MPVGFVEVLIILGIILALFLLALAFRLLRYGRRDRSESRGERGL